MFEKEKTSSSLNLDVGIYTVHAFSNFDQALYIY